VRFGLLKVWKYLTRIYNRDKIPKLPRMYASEYSSIDLDSERIMARYGIRSPSGLKLAMKRHGVTTVDELVALLEHHKAQRDIRKRLRAGLDRFSSGTTAIPHQKEIRRLVRPKKRQDLELQQRLKRLRLD
jgi:hypothetical protein